MGKLYHTHEVKEVFDKILDRMVKETVQDKSLVGLTLSAKIELIRRLQIFTDGVITEMKKDDAEYDAEIAAWREKQKGEENATT